MTEPHNLQPYLQAGMTADEAIDLVRDSDLADLREDSDPSTAVTMAYVHDGEKVDYSFHHSHLQLLAYDLMNHSRVWRGVPLSWRCGTDGLADARNSAVRDFLASSPADWLWWVDSDMGFAPDTVDQLFAVANPELRPIVSGLAFANRDAADDGMGGRLQLAAPVIMDWKHVDDEVGFDTRWNYAQNAVVRCDGVGSACVLIHRSVFERVAAEFGPNWYSRTRNPSTGAMISEDLSFCVRVKALDIPIHVHTAVKTTHAKTVWLSEEHYWQQRALNSAPSTAEGTPLPVPEPTWTIPRFAIIPTHNRPARLLALVVSLGAQCDTIIVVDNSSNPPADAMKLQASVPERVDVEVIRIDEQPPHLSRYWNVMLDRCAELAKERGQDEWDVAVFNDDSVLPAGWFTLVADGLRQGTAVVAHTGTGGFETTLKTELDNDSTRMCPHAFVTRGEAGLRADESMRWWYFDTDFDWQARQLGGVQSVLGPRVINSLANSTTHGVLAEQAEKDRATFEAKWSA